MPVQLLVGISVYVLCIVQIQVNTTLQYYDIVPRRESCNQVVNEKGDSDHQENVAREVNEVPLAPISLVDLQLKVNSKNHIECVRPESLSSLL